MKKGKKEMIGLEDVTEFLEVIFNSGNIRNEKPLSTYIIAPVSNGKTTSTKQFYGNSQVKVITDATAYGILKKYENDLREKKIRHFVIPDLLNCLARRKTSVDTFILFVNSSSEDGLSESSTYAYELKSPIDAFGWVMCVTEEAYKKKKNQLDSIGQSSRFFMVHYKYSLETISKIIDKIVRDEKFAVPHKTLKKKQRTIKGNIEIFEKAKTYARLLCNTEAEAIRVQRNLQTFLKSCAFIRNSDKVQEEDLKKLERLIYLIK